MSIYKIFSIIGVVVLFGGCTTAKQNEWFLSHAGNMPAKERIEKIKIGETKDTVIDVLGLPSSVNAFDENSWIYMSSDIKKMAFFAPEEKERNILHITFNQSDEVSDIKFLSLEDGKKIKEIEFLCSTSFFYSLFIRKIIFLDNLLYNRSF